MAKKRKTPEAEVLKAISEYLFAMMRVGKGVWWRVNNGGVYDPTKKVFRKPAGKLNYAGISDIMGVYNGKFYAIEVKAGKNKATSEQEAFGQMVESQDGVFILAYSVDDLLEIFT